MSRSSQVTRETKETKISLELAVDGSGRAEVGTGIPFLDHMLDLFARHGLFDVKLRASGDLEVDGHHTVEDIGICLGQAFGQALGDKSGIARYGESVTPMDEALVMVAVDISGRPYLVYEVQVPAELIGTYDPALTVEFLQALTNSAGLTLHVRMLRGGNTHHVVEAVFKGVARALDKATRRDERVAGIPSTKGTL